MEEDRQEQLETSVEPDSSPQDTAAPEQTAAPETATPAEEKKDPKGTGLYLMLHDFVYIFAFVTVIFVFAIRLVGVDGDSMYPTLHHGDYLCLLSNVLYRDVQPGDVIVVTRENGEFAGEPIVKRVIATGGNRLCGRRTAQRAVYQRANLSQLSRVGNGHAIPADGG